MRSKKIIKGLIPLTEREEKILKAQKRTSTIRAEQEVVNMVNALTLTLDKKTNNETLEILVEYGIENFTEEEKRQFDV